MFKHLADYLVHYLWHVRYLGYPLLGGFTIFAAYKMKPKRLTNDLINELEYLYVYCQSCDKEKILHCTKNEVFH